MAAEKGKGKEPSSPTIADAPAARMASLSLEATSPRQPPRPAAPPRPSVASKPKHLQQPKQVEPEPLSENDDEDDPFADRNEV